MPGPGRRAYGLYLYHFPVLSLMLNQVRVPESSLLRAGLGIAITFALVALSYRWLELPFLAAKRRFTPEARDPSAAAAGRG